MLETLKLSQKTQKMHKWNKMLNLTHKLFKSARNAETEPKKHKKCLK